MIALAALIVAVAFLPAVQTRIAQRQLDLHPEWRASLGSLAAGVGSLEAHDLNVEINGTLLTMPAFEAKLPVITAVWQRQLHVSHLVAKGWTLDLNGPLEPRMLPTPANIPAILARNTGTTSSGPATNASAPAIAALVFHRLLTGWNLPRDVAIDKVDLEGDVLLPTPRGTDPIAVHVDIKGGGLSPSHEGTFTIEATFPLVDQAGHLIAMLTPKGRLMLAVNASRAPSRIELDIEISEKNGTFPEGYRVSASLAAADGVRDESYAINVNRGDRTVANIVSHHTGTNGEIGGDWKVDLRESDLAPFFPKRALPAIAAMGNGRFETDAGLTRVHAVGQLATVTSHLEVIAPPLDRLGALTLNADFDMLQGGQSLRVDRLNLKLSGARPAAAVRVLQSFTFDEQTGGLRVADPNSDWLAGTLLGIPLSWVFGSPASFAIGGGDLTGEFLVRTHDGETIIRSAGSLLASGVTVQTGKKILTRGLELSAPFAAKFTRSAWTAQVSPLNISSAGQRIATIEATAGRKTEGEQPIKIAGTWNANTAALAAQPAFLEFADSAGGAASGEFSLLTGAWFSFDNKFVVHGRDPTRTLDANLHVGSDANGRITFLAPVKIAFGSTSSAFSAEGSWARTAAGGRTVLNLTGDRVALEHLTWLAAPLAAAGRISAAENPSAAASPTATRDRIPFWGDWLGRVSLDFNRLTAAGHTFADVGGTFFIERDAIKLEGGRSVFHQDRHVRAEGTLTFDATAEVPYIAKGTAQADEVDATIVFGPTPRDREPLLRGRFSIAGTLTGNGRTLAELARNTEEEFHLTGAGGSTRLFQASVANSLTEAPTPVADALGTVGSVIGALLKTKSNILQKEKNPVSPNTEAVLNFTYTTELIRYDRISLTATRASDGTLRLADITLTAADEQLTGSGQLTSTPGQPLQSWPLSLDLHFGFRGHAAEFLTAAGLISAKKDSQAYTPLNETIHFGGTLAQIDSSAWRDLLVKAAAPPPPGTKRKSN